LTFTFLSNLEANDESKLSKEEIHNLKKDGLDILNDIDRYAREGFATIPVK
jgi:ferredoxin-nitrite reductase